MVKKMAKKNMKQKRSRKTTKKIPSKGPGKKNKTAIKRVISKHKKIAKRDGVLVALRQC
jgi:hypothetical protein